MLNKISFILLVLCAFSISMPTICFNIAMPITILLKILSSKKEDLARIYNSRLFKVLLLSIVLVLIALVYTSTNNLDTGLDLVIRRIPFLILPFFFTTISKKELNIILMSFMIGVIIGVLICIINVLNTPNVYGHFNQIYISNWYWGDKILDPIDKHPSYFSLYSSFSFFIALQFLLQSKKLFIKIISVFLMLFFMTVILTLEARIITLMFPFLILIYLILKTKKIFFGVLFFITSIIAGTVFFISHPAKFHNIRILRLSDDSNVRLNIFKSAASLVKENPVFGVGSGDLQEELNKKFESYDLQMNYKDQKYNAHNQFLEEWARGGIISIITLLAIFLFVYKEAYIQNHALFFVLIVSITGISLVESVLNRQQGITFIMFFFSLFYFYKKEH